MFLLAERWHHYYKNSPWMRMRMRRRFVRWTILSGCMVMVSVSPGCSDWTSPHVGAVAVTGSGSWRESQPGPGRPAGTSLIVSGLITIYHLLPRPPRTAPVPQCQILFFWIIILCFFDVSAGLFTSLDTSIPNIWRCLQLQVYFSTSHTFTALTAQITYRSQLKRYLESL